MALDPTRAALVMSEYRYEGSIAEDASIRVKFPNADEILIDTNLDAALASSYASYLFNLTKTQAKVFTQTIEDVIYPEDFTAGPNRYTLSYSRHPVGASIYNLARAEIDWTAGTTEVTERT